MSHSENPGPHETTLTEMFGYYIEMPDNGRNGEWIIPKTCKMCGSLVTIPEKHREFHNGLTAIVYLIGRSDKLTKEQKQRLINGPK